jgi:hypothetical protein
VIAGLEEIDAVMTDANQLQRTRLFCVQTKNRSQFSDLLRLRLAALSFTERANEAPPVVWLPKQLCCVQNAEYLGGRHHLDTYAPQRSKETPSVVGRTNQMRCLKKTA